MFSKFNNHSAIISAESWCRSARIISMISMEARNRLKNKELIESKKKYLEEIIAVDLMISQFPAKLIPTSELFKPQKKWWQFWRTK